MANYKNMLNLSKPFWESSTFWINAGTIGALVLDFMIAENMLPDARYVAIAGLVLNIINRMRVSPNEPVKKLTLK